MIRSEITRSKITRSKKIRVDEIAFDIDGVFANTMGLFLEIARQDYGINHIQYGDITQYYLEKCLDVPPETINTIIDRILEGDFQNRLKPIDGARKVLSAIARNGRLLFVTARPTVSPIREWVYDMLPEACSSIEVVATGALEAKAAVLKDRGIQLFVEDSLEVCFMLHEQQITPVVFSQPWNRSPHPFQEVCHWDEVSALIDLDPIVA
jgi:uncharacterized HAD superfamily protein